MTFTAMQHAVTASMLLADRPLLGTCRPVSPGRSRQWARFIRRTGSVANWILLPRTMSAQIAQADPMKTTFCGALLHGQPCLRSIRSHQADALPAGSATKCFSSTALAIASICRSRTE